MRRGSTASLRLSPSALGATAAFELRARPDIITQCSPTSSAAQSSASTVISSK